ncbi:MAG: PRC-barrel domain containing protein [Chloroflexi bacterium]|nr:PRC-barrel domain containing protein [Chloroflexota bacterium]
MKPRILSAGTIAKDKVRNPAGEDLGRIEELMLDLQEGRIAYAVLSFGGVLGLGDKLFAIPWPALSLRPDEHAFVLNVDKDTLKNAPGFDKDHWPDADDLDWLAQVYRHYGHDPYWDRTIASGRS